MTSNRLFPIPLLGQGTAEVESLPSYLFRSAFIHGVSAGIFLRAIHERCSGGAEQPFSNHLAGKVGIETLARANNCTWNLRHTLGELTGQDLSCEPLLFLDRQIYCISTEIDAFRWCPECFSEMERLEAPLYIKQLWHMRAVHHCPVHRTPLVDQCGFCGTEQTSFKFVKPIGVCINCGRSLALRKRQLSPKEIEPSWSSLSQDVLEIFEKASRPGSINIGKYCAKYFVQRLYELTGLPDRAGDTASHKLRGLLGEYARNWKGSCRLISLRRLAYQINMSLYDLLTANERDCRLPFGPVDTNKLPVHLKQRKKIVRNHEEVYEKLLVLLDKQKIPSSLKRLARSANVSVGYLEYRYPSLVRQVVQNYQAFLNQQDLTKHYQAQAAAIQFFSGKRYRCHHHSRKEAYKVLREDTGLPKWVLKDAIQVAYRALH